MTTPRAAAARARREIGAHFSVGQRRIARRLRASAAHPTGIGYGGAAITEGDAMSVRVRIGLAGAALAGLLGLGCVTNAKLLQDNQQAAIQTAESRGRFELNCPDATATVLSQEVVQPVMEGPWVQGIPRAEYTIGVAGC